MKNILKPKTCENETMIILGIIAFFCLVEGFLILLFCLNRISLISFVFITLLFVIVYMPRFLIIKKIYAKDIIKITDDSILINKKEVKFQNIKDFKVKEEKPQVIFFINNSMVVYSHAKFYLHTSGYDLEFTAIGSEKIKLLTEFLEKLVHG